MERPVIATFHPPSSIYHPPSTVAKLLVSVRDAQEAIAALAGGADIVDVKEPARGSLGMADVATIDDVVRCISADDGRQILVSAALGEASEWFGNAKLPQLPAGLTFCKLGLSGLGQEPDWIGAWSDLRHRFEQRSAGEFQWIAVVYADWQAVDAPPPDSVIATAVETRCAGVLFDTFQKDGQTLADWLPLPELTAMVRRVQSTGMICALAGGLNREMIGSLIPVAADIFAIRTAACEAGQRLGGISESAVRGFRLAMESEETSTSGFPRSSHRPAG